MRVTKRYSVTVRGREKRWSFPVWALPEHVEDWRRDGMEVEEVLNVIPGWVVHAGLLRPWLFFEDVFNFRNPFERRGR